LCAFYKDAIGERILRCSYAFAWDEVYDPNLHIEKYNTNIDSVYNSDVQESILYPHQKLTLQMFTAIIPPIRQIKFKIQP